MSKGHEENLIHTDAVNTFWDISRLIICGAFSLVRSGECIQKYNKRVQTVSCSDCSALKSIYFTLVYFLISLRTSH